MILYATSLHASATVLGVIAGMTPFLSFLQIPAAHYFNRISYKRFMLGGWGSRTLFTMGMVLLPLVTGILDATTQLVLLLGLLLGFNFVRGLASGAWLPWISHLVPEKYLGRYLSGEAAMTNLGSFVAVILCALCLGTEPRPWQFAAIFAFSALMGLVSIIVLNRVPDVPITAEVRSSNQPVPWLEIFRHPPFQKFLQFVAVWSLAYGGLAAFIVAFLKAETGFSSGNILFITSVFFLGGLGSMAFMGHRLDRVGSKPMLVLALVAWVLMAAGWVALAGGVWEVQLSAILVLQLLMGLFATLMAVATNRLAMATIPAMGRSHFFVIYSVIANVILGLAPVAWGLVIDLIGDRHFLFAGVDWNRYSIFFALVLLVFLVAFALVRRLHEPKAASLEALLADILVGSPQRLWLRVWPRE